MTGPNTSCWMISSSWRSPLTTLASKKKPRAPIRWPPVSTLAWSGSRSMNPVTRSSWAGVVQRAEVRVRHVRAGHRLAAGLLGQRLGQVVGDPGAASTRVAAVQSWPALK